MPQGKAGFPDGVHCLTFRSSSNEKVNSAFATQALALTKEMHQRLLQNPVHIQKLTTSFGKDWQKKSYNSRQWRRQCQAVIKSHHGYGGASVSNSRGNGLLLADISSNQAMDTKEEEDNQTDIVVVFKPEKQFPCEMCVKTFSRKDSLKRHLKICKKGIRNIANMQCVNIFSTYSNRINHTKRSIALRIKSM